MNRAAHPVFSPACTLLTLPRIFSIASPPQSPSKPPTGTVRTPLRALSRPEDDMPEMDNASQASLSIPLEASLTDGGALLSRPNDFSRLNENDDALFYASARFVHHTDGAFRESLTSLYRAHLQEGASVLDICGSWDSHLPPKQEMKFSCIIGHGMNEAELGANLRLDRYFIKDLNQDPRLDKLNSLFQGLQGDTIDLPNSSNNIDAAEMKFDAVLCASGIQYLTQPVPVLREVRRVLKPGGKLIISFSTHCFQEKAVGSWLARPSLKERLELVSVYLQAAGFEIVSTKGGEEIVGGAGHIGDPFAAIVARKPAGGASPSTTTAPLTEQATMQYIPPALWESNNNLSINSTSILGINNNSEGAVSASTLEQWRRAYIQMGEDAKAIGIPASAIPPLPPSPGPEDIRKARDHLAAMIASFLSSGL